MHRPRIWAWGTFMGLGSTTLAISGSVSSAIWVGLAAGVCVLLATQRIASYWQTLAAAFSRPPAGCL